MLRSRTIALILAFTLLAPPAAFGNGTSASEKVVDVTLQDGGVLMGRCFSTEGKPIAEGEVHITLADGRTAATKTGPEGAFAFRGVSGAAKLSGPDAEVLVRAWNAQAAPPKAVGAVLLVAEGEVARGQRHVGYMGESLMQRSKRLFANPLFVTGVVATAVAVPVAIHNADDDDPNS